jgi:membrane-bound serine protease (ClpP class)
MNPTIITLLAAGLLLLGLEMITPGMIVGIIGGITLMSGVVMAFVEGGAKEGVLALIIAVAGSGILLFWYARYFPETRFGKKMTLSTTVKGGEVHPELDILVGSEAKSLTALRPSGVILVAGRRVDAQSEGEWIDSGVAVSVVRVQGGSVLVRKIA